MRGATRLLPAVAALVLVTTAGRAADPERSDAARIAALVAQLGSDSYAEREAATQALAAIGAPALDALRRAAQGQDPEVRRRAAALARALERRLATASIREPLKLRLQYRETPLIEAAADFSKKAGVTLKLRANIDKPAERKVTLDTGLVTFWEALEQFCDKAGLVEVPPALWAFEPGSLGGNSSSVTIVGRNWGPTATDVLRTTPADKPLELQLGDGKPEPRPTSRAGALRVRLAPADTWLPRRREDDREILFALDVTADGHLQWQKAVGLRIDRALDDEGKPLAQLPTSFRPPGGARAGVTVNGMPINTTPEEPDDPIGRLVIVRLRRVGEQAPKKLRELAGTVVGQVRGPEEALVKVEGVLKAAGRTVKGAKGGSVKVVEVVQEDDRVRLKVQVEGVSRGITDVPTGPFNAAVVVNGRRLGVDDDLLNSLNFALRDEKGRPFRTARAVSTGVRAGAAHEYELTYEPEVGQGAATTFVYTDRRTLLIDVPFVLKDVPLP